MRRSILLTIPMVLSCMSLVSCGGSKMSRLSASINTGATYKREGTINKDDISVLAEYDGGSQKILKSNEWTSEKFGSNTTYTFTTSGENTIDVNYSGQKYDLKITVSPKGSTDFTYDDLVNLKVNDEKVIEVKMKETGAEVDVAKIEWSINQEHPSGLIQITPDSTNKFKCTVKGLNEGTAGIDVKLTDNIANSHQHTITVDVKAA